MGGFGLAGMGISKGLNIGSEILDNGLPGLGHLSDFLSFNGSMLTGDKITNGFYDMITWGDEWAEATRKKIGFMWESVGSQIDRITNGIGDYIDSIWAKLGFAPKEKEGVPVDSTPGAGGGFYGPTPATGPFILQNYVPNAQQEAGPQVIQIDNTLRLDERVIAQVVAEIIQKNRDTYYHGFGGDPTGFQVV
jgi:hypothetical protein